MENNIIDSILKDEDDYQFPEPEHSDRQGLLAIGGKLSSSRLLKAYSHGIFPWYQPGSPILWWSPNPRLILYPNHFKLSRSLKKKLAKNFVYKIDSDFSAVITACATCPGRVDETWITPEMISAYIALHELGYAHSFEVWSNEQLVGGLYGVSLGHAFFGESMFHSQPDTSKMALYFLCTTLAHHHFDFIDCQLPTPHLLSLGASIISRKEFLLRLNESLKYPSYVGSWANWQHRQ